MYPIKKVIKRTRYRNVIYDRVLPKHDYLKYWKVVKYWARKKYNLSSADIDMLLFLYTEGLFTRSKYLEYENIFKWDNDRFARLMREGFIHNWVKKNWGEEKKYELTFKARKMCASIYRKLNGEEPISETPQHNPIFKASARYTDKVHAMAIKKFNQESRQRHAPK